MPLVLGIHHGHHASCALVRDGKLVAAIEQERVTRAKADGQEGLSNRLPVHACLQAAGASLADVDLIVSSFQAATAGGVGFHRPLVERGFDLFDPFDDRHLVVSHHLAHGLSALHASGFREAAVLISDLAGSTTCDGADFVKPFRTFAAELQSLAEPAKLRTECLSIYEADLSTFTLKHREYCVPHTTPDVFVHSAASLYDNVSRMVFGVENAHGRLMALAAMAPPQASPGIEASKARDNRTRRVRSIPERLAAPLLVARGRPRSCVAGARGAAGAGGGDRGVRAAGTLAHRVAEARRCRGGLPQHPGELGRGPERTLPRVLRAQRAARRRDRGRLRVRRPSRASGVAGEPRSPSSVSGPSTGSA